MKKVYYIYLLANYLYHVHCDMFLTAVQLQT